MDLDVVQVGKVAAQQNVHFGIVCAVREQYSLESRIEDRTENRDLPKNRTGRAIWGTSFENPESWRHSH